jgi:deazaflavin-dependent oxidoreductase (nitroreductase family)
MRSVVCKFVHWFNYTAIPWYTSLGFSKGTITLEIAGRKTGKPTHVSLTTVRRGEARYLVSLYNESQWVKNVRAAQGRAAILSGGKTPVRLVEISQEERAPILLGYVQQRAFSHSGEESAQLFFGLGPKPSLADMEAIADRYVVYQIELVPN